MGGYLFIFVVLICFAAPFLYVRFNFFLNAVIVFLERMGFLPRH